MNFFSKKLTLIANNIPVPSGAASSSASTQSSANNIGPSSPPSKEQRRLPPPQPDFSNLTPDELNQLKKVLQKQEQFETEIEKSVR